jgi:hypothetical protein
MTDSKAVCLRFSLDLSHIERADDGYTTHFGGSFTLDGVQTNVRGDDRDTWTWVDDIIEVIQGKCQAEWGEYPDSEDLMDAVEQIEDAAIAVHRDGPGKFQVLVEDIF